MINSTENEDDDNQQNNDEKIVVLEEEKEETVVQQEEDVPHDNVEEEIVEDGLGPPLEGPEEEGVKEVEEEQPLTTTFQLDYLNEEDSEDDEFVVTIGDIKAKVISTSSFQSKQQQNKIINGTIDLDTNPTLKDGTPIYDLDLATMEDKPWRKPGADITDYFNYGFNEETWNQYCERQRKFRQEFGNNDQSAINKAILSNIQLTGSLTGSTQIGLTTFAGGRQLVNLSGGIGQQQQQEKQQMQQQKVQKIIVDLCKPQHNTNSVEDAMMSASVIPLIRTVISETGVVRQESTEIMPSSFKTEVSPKLENILLSSTNIDSNSMLEHSDAFVHSPISKTPPPIEQQQQPINVIDFSKPPPSFDPLIPPPLSLVNQLPQVVPSLGSQMVPQQHQLPVVVQQTITQTSSANLLSTIPPVASANSGTNLDLPPGVEEGDGPPGISSSIPPVSSMPPPQRILDFSQPPPTSQFSYNPTPSSFSMGGPPSTFAPPGSHYPMHQQSSYAPRHHFQPSYRHPFGGFGGRGGFHDRFRSSNRGISRPIDDHRDRDRDNNNRGDRDRSDSGSDSGPSHRKKRRSSRTRSRSRSPSTGRSRRKDDDRSSKHRSSDHHKDSKDRKRKKEKDRSKERHSRSSRRSPSIKKESRIKSERRSSERDKDDRDSRSRHRSSPRRKEKESSVKSELRIKPEQRSPERD